MFLSRRRDACGVSLKMDAQAGFVKPEAQSSYSLPEFLLIDQSIKNNFAGGR
jgi:hypothetical protein